MEGIIGRIDLEEAEDPYDPQDPECNETGASVPVSLHSGRPF